ncbi:hypothetical protein VmeM32_00183 [Vibrio phage vB_VmeM-32]|nr:hypothetical protein VmeM32_00183 [Vibrio phage vB_VmeM-32]
MKMMDDCVIVDGLQRMTAINDYLNDKIPAYGFLYSELLKEARPRMIFNRLHLTVTVLTFESEREVVQFYIDINRGITHSNDDIKRAEDYLKGLLTK